MLMMMMSAHVTPWAAPTPCPLGRVPAAGGAARVTLTPLHYSPACPVPRAPAAITKVGTDGQRRFTRGTPARAGGVVVLPVLLLY